MTRNTLRCSVRLAGLLAGAGLLLSTAGCYERVVGASGFGADSVNVTKPNGPDTRSSNAKTYTYKKSTTKELPSPGSPQE